MNGLFFNPSITDKQRREGLYKGQLFVFSPSKTTSAFIHFARELIEEAFDGLFPPTAQDHMEVEAYVNVLKTLKPSFIHHPQSKIFLQKILTEMGCDPMQTYFDVPRMRSSTSDGYLTSGIAYAFHPHRDTWYSAHMCQINWWLPIYDVEPGNVMAIHTGYFDKAVKNGSSGYNYQNWQQTSRVDAAKHIKKDTRKQPHPEEAIEIDPNVRVVTEPGGMLLFSAAHLHSSVPNFTGKTRFSIDFRTIHIGDAMKKHGAPNVDSYCTGTNLGDFLRVADLAHVDTEIIESYMSGQPVSPSLKSRDSLIARI